MGAEKNIKFNEEQKKRLVNVVSFIKCTICKQNYFPNDTDISLNGYFYFKNCKICRKNRAEMKSKSLNKKHI